MSDSVARGSVLWCSKDSASYNGLQTRWAKNPKLRKWWQSLSPDEQAQWFLKSQNMQGKRRFDEVIYTEVSTRAEEFIEDDVTKFKTFKQFLLEGLQLGISRQQLEQDFKDIIDNNRT